MSRALWIVGGVVALAGCKSSSFDLLEQGLPLRCFENGSSNQCRGGWTCGHEGICFNPEVPAARLCASEAECSGWHCSAPVSGALGRCYSLADAGAVACRSDGGLQSPDCAPEWSCGLDFICFNPVEPAGRPCQSDSYCAPGYRCSVTRPATCVAATAEALPQTEPRQLTIDFLTPLVVPEIAPFKFSYSPQTTGFGFVVDGGVFVIERDILSYLPGNPNRVRVYPNLGEVHAISLSLAPPSSLASSSADLALVGDQVIPLGGKPPRAPFPSPVPGARRVHQVPLDAFNSFTGWRFVIFSDSEVAWLSDTAVLPMHPPSGAKVFDVAFDVDRSRPPGQTGHVLLATDRGLYGARFVEVLAADGGVIPWRPLISASTNGISHADCDGGTRSPTRWLGVEQGNSHELVMELERDGGSVIQEYNVAQSLPAGGCAPGYLTPWSTLTVVDAQGCDAGTWSDWLSHSTVPYLQCSNSSGTVARVINARDPAPLQFASPPLEPDRNNFQSQQGLGLGQAYLDRGGGVTIVPTPGPAGTPLFRPFFTSKPALISGDSDAGFALIDAVANQYGPPFELGATLVGGSGGFVCGDFEANPTEAVAASLAGLVVVAHSAVLATYPPATPAARPVTHAVLDNSADLVRVETRTFNNIFGNPVTAPFPICAPSVQSRLHAFAVKDRDGNEIFVVGGFDRIWAAPATTADAGVAHMRVTASPAPFTSIESLTVIAAAQSTPGAVLEGFAVSSGRLFQLTAQTAERWRTSEVFFATDVGTGLDVWNDGSRFRFTVEDGTTYSLPAFVSISPPAPEPLQRVVGFCGSGYGLGAASLYRLDPTPGAAGGSWTPVPLPARRLVGDPAHRFQGGLLHLGRGELHVVDNVGNVLILRGVGCE